MVTGKTPFQGTPGEVMHQHLRAPLPLDELEGVPQPLVVLLETLLEKDPGRRFQNPGGLLKALPTITERIEAGRRITREAMHKMPPAALRTGTRKPPARQGPKKISVAKLPVTGSDLFGREEDVAFLDDAWANQAVNVVTIVAWGGVGKSILVNHWLRRVFFAAIGADEADIEASVGEAIRIAKEQKSVSLEKRAEAAYAEYRRQKASASGGRGFRRPVGHLRSF